MKVLTGLFIAALLATPALLFAEDNPNFELAPNGVTVLCPDAEFGETGTVNGITYTKRTRAEITIQNAGSTCTSGITNM